MTFSDGSIATLIGCLVWLPIAVWVYSLISWTIMGEIEPLFGVTGAMLGMTLGGAIMLQPNPKLAPYLVGAVVSLVVIFPWLRSAAQKRELALIDIEAIERAYEQLRERPDGFGPKLRIARLIYGRGMRGHAIILAEEAIGSLPKSLVEDDLRQVRLWRSHVAHEEYDSLFCVECGKENVTGTLFCVRCHAPILLYHAKGSWTGRRMAKRLLAAWVASVAGLVAIPMAATTMPPVLAGIVVSLLLLGAGMLVYLAFKPEGHRT